MDTEIKETVEDSCEQPSVDVQKMKRFTQVMLCVSLGLALLASYQLVSPYIYPICIAFVLGTICYPVHRRILVKLGNRQNVAALLSSSILTFIIIIPVLLLSAAIVGEGIDFFRQFNAWVQDRGPERLMDQSLESGLNTLSTLVPGEVLDPQKLKAQLASTLAGLGTSFVKMSGHIAGNLTDLGANFLLMLFVFFFVLRDFETIMTTIRHMLPLSRSQEDALFLEIQKVSKSALLGSMLTALCQGVAGGFIFLVAGLPGLFWGTIMAFAALIPVVGTALIWIPATIYLYAAQDYLWGTVVLIWCVVVVGSIDNFLRPIFMQGASAMNTLMIFFSLLGGIHVFGLVGLVFGPLVFGITLVLLRLVTQEFSELLDYQDRH